MILTGKDLTVYRLNKIAKFVAMTVGVFTIVFFLMLMCIVCG